ncbi:MAG: hypothetical protein ACR2RV_10600 [Verrucomicrobiales bacterium]
MSQLATEILGEPSHFQSTLQVLNLIRDHIGFDHSQIERYTSATAASGVPGSVMFFTLTTHLPLDQHFAQGRSPISPELDEFHGKPVYKLRVGEQTFGLFSPGGQHFLFGNWELFKLALRQNSHKTNEITKILERHSAPIILGSNPRRQVKRHTSETPFGSVIAIDFDQAELAFLMQEEHPTPDGAIARLAVIEQDMPKVFKEQYALTTKMGVRFQSFADGRHVVFGGTSALGHTKRLLETLLGPALPSDPRATAKSNAARVIELFEVAKSAGADCGSMKSAAEIVEALVVGIDHGAGEPTRLPFLTSIEQQQIAELLLFEDGEILIAPEPEEPLVVAMGADEKELRRHARVIATLSSSAAAVDSPQLKELATVEEIVAAICSTGISSGPGYKMQTFKGPELSSAEVARVAEFLVPSHGYLVFQASSEGAP